MKSMQYGIASFFSMYKKGVLNARFENLFLLKFDSLLAHNI